MTAHTDPTIPARVEHADGLRDLPPRLRAAVLLARRQRDAMVRAATRRIIFAALRAGHQSSHRSRP